jgi:hypothetical protein
VVPLLLHRIAIKAHAAQLRHSLLMLSFTNHSIT